MEARRTTSLSSVEYFTVTKTEHFLRRQAQGKISDAVAALILERDYRFYEGDDRVYFLGRKDFPSHSHPDAVHSVDGPVVVVTPGGVLATTYRNPKFLREPKKRRNSGRAA